MLLWLSVAFAHHEVQTAKDGHYIAQQTTRKKLGQNAQIHKRGGANLQPMRHTAALAANIKPKLPLWVFGCKINFSRGRVEAFGYDNKMMDQLLHLRHDV